MSAGQTRCRCVTAGDKRPRPGGRGLAGRGGWAAEPTSSFQVPTLLPSDRRASVLTSERRDVGAGFNRGSRRTARADRDSFDAAMAESPVANIDPDFAPVSRPRSCTWPLRRPDPGPGESSEDPGVAGGESLIPGAEGVRGVGLGRGSSGGKKSAARRNAWGNLSYADLITKAIESTPEKRLTLSQIYEWMVRCVPYFRGKEDTNSSAGWKNSIRHNLSLHSRFMRVQNEGTGKSSWWVVNPDASKGGKSPRRRATSMESNSSKIARSRARAVAKKKALLGAAGIPVEQSGSPGWGSSSAALGPDEFEAWNDFRSRTGSNASSIGGRLSPILANCEPGEVSPQERLPPPGPYPAVTMSFPSSLPCLAEVTDALSLHDKLSEEMMDDLLQSLDNAASPTPMAGHSVHSLSPSLLSTSLGPGSTNEPLNVVLSQELPLVASQQQSSQYLAFHGLSQSQMIHPPIRPSCPTTYQTSLVMTSLSVPPMSLERNPIAAYRTQFDSQKVDSFYKRPCPGFFSSERLCFIHGSDTQHSVFCTQQLGPGALSSQNNCQLDHRQETHSVPPHPLEPRTSSELLHHKHNKQSSFATELNYRQTALHSHLNNSSQCTLHQNVSSSTASFPFQQVLSESPKHTIRYQPTYRPPTADVRFQYPPPFRTSTSTGFAHRFRPSMTRSATSAPTHNVFPTMGCRPLDQPTFMGSTNLQSWSTHSQQSDTNGRLPSDIDPEMFNGNLDYDVESLIQRELLDGDGLNVTFDCFPLSSSNLTRGDGNLGSGCPGGNSPAGSCGDGEIGTSTEQPTCQSWVPG
uniref:Forkhead box protein O n=1 Tax=Eptatretus burgeri TaxID=7764 RepID=A0A8C4Q5I1_EPTBU